MPKPIESEKTENIMKKVIDPRVVINSVRVGIEQLNLQKHWIKKNRAISADSEAIVLDELINSLESAIQSLKKTQGQGALINQSPKRHSQLVGAPLTNIQSNNPYKDDIGSLSKFSRAVQAAFTKALDNKILNPEPRTVISRLFEGFKSFYNNYIAGVESSKAIINKLSDFTTKTDAAIQQAEMSDKSKPETLNPVTISEAASKIINGGEGEQRAAFVAIQAKIKAEFREMRADMAMTNNPMRKSEDPNNKDDNTPSSPRI